MGLRYRAWQLRQLLAAGPLSAEAAATVQALLSSAEWELFQRLRYSDQWHSYRVLKMLQEAGRREPALLTAALLHDVGKTCLRLSVLDRCVIVVVGKLWPAQAQRWGMAVTTGAPEPVWLTTRPFGWRTPFVVREQHAAWSAALAQAAGSAPLAVALMRQHQASPETVAAPLRDLLTALQWADDQN